MTQTHHKNNAPQLLLTEINVKDPSVDACIARAKCNHTCNLFWHKQTTSRNNRQDELWSAGGPKEVLQQRSHGNEDGVLDTE